MRRRALVGAMPALALASALGACASTPPPDAGAITSGRLALRVEASGARAAQSLSAAFELRGSAERGSLELLSPLGTLIVRARWQPGAAQLATAEGEQRFATLDELAERALGERVPLAALPDWVAGRPWAGMASEQVADGFIQEGWQVDTRAHAEGRIVARRAAAAAAPAVTLRIVLDANPS
jgi:outer membrane lipoprotein LolB